MNPCEEMRLFFLRKLDEAKRIDADNNSNGEMAEEYLKFLCGSTVARNLFMYRYKDFPALETLPAEEKTEMKRYVHNLFPGKPVEFKLQAAKIIYTVGSILLKTDYGM